MTCSSLRTDSGEPSAILLPFTSATDPRTHAANRAQVVLDHHDRGPVAAYRAHELEGLVRLGRVETGEHFVEQQHLGPGRQRARDFEPLLSGQVQRSRVAVRALSEAAERQRRHGRLAGGGPPVRPWAAPEECADHDVVEHGHVAEWAHDLMRRRDAGDADVVRGSVGDTPAREGHPCRRWGA